MLVSDLLLYAGYLAGACVVLFVVICLSLFVTGIVARHTGWLRDRKMIKEELMVREVEPGSGVPDGPSTKRLFAALSSGNKIVFVSWLRGEVYRQSRGKRKMAHAEALELAMTPDFAEAECETSRT